MLYGQDRRSLRDVFFRAWHKHVNGEPLEGVEPRVVAVIGLHPEYQALLADPEAGGDRDWQPEHGESNPFLHMAMHLAIEEQLAVDQPRGLRAQYQRLRAGQPDDHATQHLIMDCLGETLWRAQRQGAAPSDRDYLDCLARLPVR